jgi:hypothetical protein
MRITEEKDENNVDYYLLIMENEKDVIEISNLLYQYTHFETIEEYKKYLRGNEKLGYYSDLPCKVYKKNKEYKTFKQYYDEFNNKTNC